MITSGSPFPSLCVDTFHSFQRINPGPFSQRPRQLATESDSVETVAMSCLLTEEARFQKRINSRINRELQRDYKDSKREIKLLLLGACVLSWSCPMSLCRAWFLDS